MWRSTTTLSAVNDSNSVTEDGPLSATGNVLTSNDPRGRWRQVSTVGTPPARTAPS
ncbi:hypothetical protein [Gallaecimonas pentaromativorans]|uniref:hypothetical protein n=1 Tax=Gallaecimonas pentaromativorans TaxID=584787 RepID=UPI003A90179D